MLTSLTELQIASADGSAPKYERLRDHIVECVQSGQLSPGDLLPSEQTLVGALGIARSTVRQALATLEREGLVRRVQGKGSYIHDDALQKLSKKADLLALVVPEVGRGFYPSLQSGFENSASASGSQIIVADTGNNVDHQANVILQLMDKKVGGLAIVPPTIEPVPVSQIRVLQSQSIPVVFCHRRVEGVRAPLITFDALEVGRLAGRHIAESNGHRRAAFVASHRGAMAEQNEAGLREVMEANGGGLSAECVYYGVWSVETFDYRAHSAQVERALVKMMELPNRPTVIYTSFDTEAELIYLILTKLGLRIPEDVSIVGFGGAQRDRPLLQQLTSIVVDEAEIGKKAAVFLNEMIAGTRDIEDGETLSMPLSISDGETLGKAPQENAANN